TRSWSAADLVLTGEAHEWAGLEAGHRRQDEHRLRVSSTGRGAAARRREVVVAMPLPTRPASRSARRPQDPPASPPTYDARRRRRWARGSRAGPVTFGGMRSR